MMIEEAPEQVFMIKSSSDPNYFHTNYGYRPINASRRSGRRISNESHISDISTTPFNLNSNSVNTYGPIELHKTDERLASPIEVYSRKKMLNEMMKNTEQDSGHFENQVEYEIVPEMMHENQNDHEMYQYYQPSSVMDESSTMFPYDHYENMKYVEKTPKYVIQIPRPVMKKPHPRPYDWENYRRRPKLQELPPSYVIVGSPVPDPPEPEMKPQEPVKTEEDKIADYEKDYKILPSGINSYLKNKLKFEVDWITVAKILLKLIIFKKIIKLIVILGLLLFVPKYYKWSNTYLNDSTTHAPIYDHHKWQHKWDKFHKYKYPRRKWRRSTTTTSTTSTTSTTTPCPTTTTTTTTEHPTTTTTTTTSTTPSSTSTEPTTTIHPWCHHFWCHYHNTTSTSTTTTTSTTPSSRDYIFDDNDDNEIQIGDDDDSDEDEDFDDFENKDIPVEEALPLYDNEPYERNEYQTEYINDTPNYYDTFRAVADAHSLDPQRLADIALFLTQAFEAWSYKSLICYGEEDLHCRFFYLYDIMDRTYPTRNLYDFFKNYWTDWWTRRKMSKSNNDNSVKLETVLKQDMTIDEKHNESESDERSGKNELTSTTTTTVAPDPVTSTEVYELCKKYGWYCPPDYQSDYYYYHDDK
uniref:CSON004152 protein n=1 Tax=Culicoides sonorensis TaxID=179676 RepID=A0A336LEC5_CULSO